MMGYLLNVRSPRGRVVYMYLGGILAVFLIVRCILQTTSNSTRKIQPRVLHSAKVNASLNRSFESFNKNPFIFLSIEESLLVLLLPSEDSTLEKLSASAHTWGKTVPKLMIFVDKDYPLLSVPSNVQVNRMFKIAHVNSHPSTTELLQILEYLYKLEFQQWKWFFFAPENIYINSFVGSEFLSLVDPFSDVVYVGTNSQIDTASYCAKESGVLLNKVTLKKIINNNLSVCQKLNCSSYSWDKGFGMFIAEVSNAQCSLQPSKYFLKEEQEISLTSLLYRDSTYNHAFSIYPVTTPSRMYSLHYFYTSHEYLRLSKRVESLSRMMTESCSQLPDHITKTSEEIQLGCDLVRPESSNSLLLMKHRKRKPFQPKTQYQYRSWNYFDHKDVYIDWATEPRLFVGTYKHLSHEYRHAMNQITREVNKRHHKKRLKFHSLVNGYVKNDPLFGNEYIIDALYTRGKNNTNDTIQERVRLLQPLRDNYAVKLTKSDTTDAVNIIVPISGVTQRCYEYIDMFNKLYAQDNHLRLVLVVFGEEVRKIYNKVVSSTLIATSNITVIKGIGRFSRARALNQGMQMLQDNELAFLCDIDMLIDISFFNRCRRNTAKGEMVYYPEVFKLYSPIFTASVQMYDTLIMRDKGHWASYAYSMLCIYKSDYSKVGGLDTKMMGWGGEDVKLFQRVLEGRLEILRAPDLGLVHRWHFQMCSNNTMTDKYYRQCLTSRAEILGDRRQLAHFIYHLHQTSPDWRQKLAILN